MEKAKRHGKRILCWRESCKKLHDETTPMSNCPTCTPTTARLQLSPARAKQFELIAPTNLFGDILSLRRDG